MIKSALEGPIVCFGEMLLRLATQPGRLIADAQALDLAVGGAEANVAVALASLGWATRMVTAVPANPLGARVRGAVAACGVETGFIAERAGRMGLYFMEAGASLRPSSVIYDRAGSAFALAQADQFDFAAALKGASLLHLSGITAALGPHGAQLCQGAIDAAKAQGVPVSFDVNFRETLWRAWDSDPAATLARLIGQADILFAGHRDMALVLGQRFSDDPALRRRQAVDAAFAAFPEVKIMASTARHPVSQTHHRLSARVDARADQHQTAEIDITDIADRVGTGDAFAAGVLHGWLSGGGACAMAEAGLALSALKHGLHGDFSRATRGELDAFTGVGGDVRR